MTTAPSDHRLTSTAVPRRGSVWNGLGLALLVAAVAPLVLWRDAPVVRTISLTFVGIVLEALPFVLWARWWGG